MTTPADHKCFGGQGDTASQTHLISTLRLDVANDSVGEKWLILANIDRLVALAGVTKLRVNQLLRPIASATITPGSVLYKI